MEACTPNKNSIDSAIASLPQRSATLLPSLLPVHCRWLSVRLETLGALAAFSAAVLAIESRGAASQMGLTLSYALQITSLTSMTVRLASVAENAFNAVERIAEYSRLKEEAPAVIEGSAPDDWPSAGKVCYSSVTRLLCICYSSVTQPHADKNVEFTKKLETSTLSWRQCAT